METDGPLAGLIQCLCDWIERDEKLIASQATYGWTSYRVGPDNVRIDTTQDDLKAARDRIENNRRIIDAWERHRTGR